MELNIVERTAVSGGYTPAERFRARLEDGRRVFVKRAVDAMTAGWLETEARAYRELQLPCMAELVDFGTEDGRATLVLEDLGEARWPPPWRTGDVDRVLVAMDHVWRSPIPDWVPTLPATAIAGWAEVAADPEPFLALGRCGRSWLDRALPVLLTAEKVWPSDPLVLSHFDLRSDNLCLLDDRVVVVDWNHVCRAPFGLDAAFWAASLCAEGERRPEELVGHQPHWAARVSGFFAARAGLPVIPSAPRVRWIQQVQLDAALPWVVRAFGLDPLSEEHP